MKSASEWQKEIKLRKGNISVVLVFIHGFKSSSIISAAVNIKTISISDLRSSWAGIFIFGSCIWHPWRGRHIVEIRFIDSFRNRKANRRPPGVALRDTWLCSCCPVKKTVFSSIFSPFLPLLWSPSMCCKNFFPVSWRIFSRQPMVQWGEMRR